METGRLVELRLKGLFKRLLPGLPRFSELNPELAQAAQLVLPCSHSQIERLSTHTGIAGSFTGN